MPASPQSERCERGPTPSVAPSCRQFNLVRRRAQIAEIEALGGDVVICTDDGDWPARLREATAGQGIIKAIDCVAGRTGAVVARGLAPGGRMLVYGALSSHRQTDPAAFELPLFAPALIYSAATVQGWFLFHWLASHPLSEGRSALRGVLERLASGVLRLPPALR